MMLYCFQIKITMEKEDPQKPAPKDAKNRKLSLTEYLALRKKEEKKSLDGGLPLTVKFFISIPLLVLCAIMCFGLFCIPHLKTLEDSQTADESSQ